MPIGVVSAVGEKLRVRVHGWVVCLGVCMFVDELARCDHNPMFAGKSGGCQKKILPRQVGLPGQHISEKDTRYYYKP